jgi:excisionase family DNA binding protein
MEHKSKQGYSPEPTETETEPLLTVGDLAIYLNASRSTIYRLIREGSLRPIYFDDRPRFLPQDVLAFVQSHQNRQKKP